MKKSKKPKKIRSIKHQITFTFIGLLFLSILTISMINGAFLEKYYVSKKTETLLEAREVLSQINTDSMTEDDVESEQEELSFEIIQESSRNNLTWAAPGTSEFLLSWKFFILSPKESNTSSIPASGNCS